MSTRVGCKLRKNGGDLYWESSSGYWVLSHNIYFGNSGIGLAFLPKKTAFGKEETTCTYPSQQICWSGNWPASHYFFHLVKMLKCVSISSGKVVNIFHLFIFLL